MTGLEFIASVAEKRVASKAVHRAGDLATALTPATCVERSNALDEIAHSEIDWKLAAGRHAAVGATDRTTDNAAADRRARIVGVALDERRNARRAKRVMARQENWVCEVILQTQANNARLKSNPENAKKNKRVPNKWRISARQPTAKVQQYTM